MIYLVAVWGNYRDDDANGEDTCLLVRAASHLEAVEAVKTSAYAFKPHCVILLGHDIISNTEAEVISLPFIQHAIIGGRELPLP